eukprot:CAMPEP_0179348256 /NCGR_PEP_ID=MMETSP0797-20121207/73601_1 /TAXON_ID=47934 /ORGANISM="Dinophysis acuminata, Strain DAEP01" /LENGTH=503 /DNA_ID=CAMNT_0021063041 /DNA_START=186 /DNA_END=1697 /DNA_ORIENTATION=+
MAASPFHDLWGPATPVSGSSWQLRYELFPDVGLDAPRPVADAFRADLLKALRGNAGALWNGSMPDCRFDLPDSYQRGVGDTYSSGKMLARLARLVVIAAELGQAREAYFREMVERLARRLEVWWEPNASNPFMYDTSWGGLVSCGCIVETCDGKCAPHCARRGESLPDCPALEDARLSFGNGFYHSHHHNYGDFVYSAAVVAKYNPAWEKKWRQHILAMVRDYGNPSKADTNFPVARNKDWFLGFSWSSGIPETHVNGRYQERASESINSYYALYAYGAVVDAHFARDLKDFGRLLTAMELHSADVYWHPREHSQLYDPDPRHRMVGVLWDHMAEYRTRLEESSHKAGGAQLSPYTPVMEGYLKKDWVAQHFPAYKRECDWDPQCRGTGWSWPLCLEQAVLDPSGAHLCLQSLPNDTFSIGRSASRGNSLTNSLHWIATRPQATSFMQHPALRPTEIGAMSEQGDNSRLFIGLRARRDWDPGRDVATTLGTAVRDKNLTRRLK